MSKKNLFLFLTIIFTILTVSSFTKEQYTETETDHFDYICEKINWKFNIPSGWNIKNIEKIAQKLAKTQKAIEAEKGISIAEEIPLLYITLGNKNRFNSNIARCDMNKENFIEMIERNYRDWLNFWESPTKGFEIKSKRQQNIIDGVTFETLSIEMIHPETKEIFGRWKLYDALINGWFFYMNYICSDYDAWKSIVSSIKNSKFN